MCKVSNTSINYAPSAPDSLHCASFQLPPIGKLDKTLITKEFLKNGQKY